MHTKQKPILKAHFKQIPSDFIVKEKIHFANNLTGNGEHLWIYIKKSGVNTQFSIQCLAECVNIAVNDIGYSGLKDRQAVTYQWLSLRLPKVSDIAIIEQSLNEKMGDGEFVEIISHNWHNKKLMRGVHNANEFNIWLRDVIGDKTEIETALKAIQLKGFPNFFGEQRFGREENNLTQATHYAQKILKQKSPKKKLSHKESLLISAMRSFIFNQILEKRVENKTWDKAVVGDVFNLNGTGAVFVADIDDEIKKRLEMGDIHPTAPLVGVVSKVKASGQALELEESVLNTEQNQLFIEALLKLGLKEARRALRVMVGGLDWRWQGDDLYLTFGLPTGAFATSLLDNLVEELIFGAKKY